ncbi:GntR family transcriptional regulator [Bradyrhizobium sp. LTSP849]|uniref:GntR family transcriptional regulator n=1 Tax=Bradyrhizobium sp. LTSP849 TaxID=1615890 RepID=UPI0005D228D0|nr:GntR family transcriptional regulator [Bradyrhizobium sp. LTSP849]KJC55465.1 GntR family transcriptional regulator [Bradyrhizobium sp. LTSP849]
MKRVRSVKRKSKRPEPKRGEPEAVDPRSIDDDPVVQDILTAISQKRLKPGAKLGEDKLAAAFGTTRIHIRQALAHLASRKVVMQIPNRGAFVYRPSWEEAQEIFAARRLIETATVAAAIDRLDKSGKAALKAHMELEARHDRNDRWASLSVTAEFHILVAKLAGNRVLLDMSRELMLRTSLAIATFEQPDEQDCSPDAHPDIGALILARDKAGAIHAMRHHLEEMEQRIRPQEGRDEVDELTAIFQEIGARAARAGG